MKGEGEGEGEGESTSQLTLTREGITSQSFVLACVKGGGGSPLCQFLVRDFMSFLEIEGKTLFSGQNRLSTFSS